MTGQSYQGLEIDGDDATDAMVDFKRGDPAELAKWLRGDKPIDKCLRTFLAGIVDETIAPQKRPRGASSRLTKANVRWIRSWHAFCKNDKSHGFSMSRIIEGISQTFNVSESTVRDVLAKRGRFAEK